MNQNRNGISLTASHYSFCHSQNTQFNIGQFLIH